MDIMTITIMNQHMQNVQDSKPKETVRHTPKPRPDTAGHPPLEGKVNEGMSVLFVLVGAFLVAALLSKGSKDATR